MSKMREASCDVDSSTTKSNYSDDFDDDNDSLGCALNDYNRLFYGNEILVKI